MFGLFKKDPKKKLLKQIATLRTQAMQFQRNGKLREFADLTAEIEVLESKLDAIEASSSPAQA